MLIGLLVVQVKLTEQDEPSIAIKQDEADEVNVPASIRVGVTVTVQAPVIAPVVYVVPESVPPQPVTFDAPTEYPAVAPTVKVVVDPWLTLLEVGVIVPPVPTDVETVYEFKVKVAETVHAAVIAPVVYVLPDRVPPQPVTVLIVYPVLGVTVKEVVDPCATEAEVGEIVPPVPADVETV